ncbi:SMAD/FHA domain, microspherule protein domain protein, partial [Tanacetum coccineum]
AGASLEALAKGAVKFSRRFTFRELRDRGLDNMKGSDKVPEKRKSIRRHYHAMRKRIKNEFFSSPNLGFFEERNLHNYNHQEHKFQDHVTDNHEAHGGDPVLDLGFEEKDFEILRQAFPESIGTVATTSKTNIVDNPANAFHIDGCHKSVENNFLNGSTREEGGLYKFTQDVSPSRNKLMGSFDSNNEIKNGTCFEETGPSATPPIEKLPKTDKSAGFGGKQHFHSPQRNLALPEDCDHIRETKGSPRYDGPHQESHVESSRIGFNISGGVQEGEYTDLPDSLLNFSNEDDILFMDADVKDTMHDISNPLLLGFPK